MDSNWHLNEREAEENAMEALLPPEAVQREIDLFCEKVSGTLMLLDWDGFRQVNECYGREQGDRLLERFAQLLRSMVRSSDPAGHIGGDMFIVYLQKVTDEDVLQDKLAQFNEQLLAAAGEVLGEEPEFPLGVSAGAVFAPAEGMDFATLCHKAEQALEKAKEDGGHGCVVYHTEGAEDVSLRQDILRMQMALGDRHHEPGAYRLEFEEFQVLYRFLVRLVENYRTRIQVLQFRLPKAASREQAVQFQDMLVRTLRRSDCVTRSGRRHFLVALMEAGPDDALLVQERIHSAWESLMGEEACAYTFETDSIGGMV